MADGQNCQGKIRQSKLTPTSVNRRWKELSLNLFIFQPKSQKKKREEFSYRLHQFDEKTKKRNLMLENCHVCLQFAFSSVTFRIDFLEVLFITTKKKKNKYNLC